MLRILKQFLPLIVILIVLASIMQVLATTEKSSSQPKLSFWERVLIAVGLREKPTVEETRQFEYIPGRLQEGQPTFPSYQLPVTSDQLPTTSDQTPASPASPNRGEPPAGFQNPPPLPPLPPSRPSTLGVKTASDAVKTTNTITGFFGSIWRSIIADLGFAKPPKPPIPPALPASPSLGGPRTLGVFDQRPPLPPLPPIPPLPPR